MGKQRLLDINTWGLKGENGGLGARCAEVYDWFPTVVISSWPGVFRKLNFLSGPWINLHSGLGRDLVIISCENYKNKALFEQCT